MAILVADSTFFICFLDDIKQPTVLLEIGKKFVFRLSPVVSTEIKKSQNYSKVSYATCFQDFKSELNLGEALRPFFSNAQLKKGESEVIAISYILHNMGVDFFLILDDWDARNFVEIHLGYMHTTMRGTVGFLGDCYCTHQVFDKEKTLSLLDEIDNSTFRVKKTITAQVRKRIEEFK